MATGCVTETCATWRARKPRRAPRTRARHELACSLHPSPTLSGTAMIRPGIASALPLASFGLARASLAQEPPATLETSPPAAAPPAFQAFSDTELQLLGMFGPARLVDDATDGAFILTFQHFSTW